MKERPILFSGPMVLALLREVDPKGQTRRGIDKLTGLGRRFTKITELQPSNSVGYDWIFRDRNAVWNDLTHAQLLKHCPYGQVGDRLWVRENYQLFFDTDRDMFNGEEDEKTGDGYRVGYVATDGIQEFYDCSTEEITDRQKPSIFMYRWASRITLEITEVRVQRLNEISAKDAEAEGVEFIGVGHGRRFKNYQLPGADYASSIASFWSLWDSINGKRPGAAWADNPWVWAITFKKLSNLKETA